MNNQYTFTKCKYNLIYARKPHHNYDEDLVLNKITSLQVQTQPDVPTST